jgi:hypothetical protein
MTSSSAAPVAADRTSRAGRQGLTRVALAAVGALGILVVAARAADAQTSPAQAARTSPQHRGAWEFLVPGGGLVPTGVQRSVIKDAHMTAAQVSYAVRPAFAITGTVGWARSRDLASAGDPKLDIFTYDLGAEARTPEWFKGRSVTFRAFAGAGAGARSYNHRKLDVDATHDIAGYGAVGGELGMGRVGLRLEVRDYATGFKPLGGGGTADTRNDLAILAGLRFTRQRARRD